MDFEQQPLESNYYVYILAYPNGKVFYVGKGKGRRIEHHEYEARRGLCRCEKCQVIQSIWRGGESVVRKIVFRGATSEEALVHETKLIRKYAGQLANIRSGRKQKDLNLLYTQASNPSKPFKITPPKKITPNPPDKFEMAHIYFTISDLERQMRYARLMGDREAQIHIRSELDAYRVLIRKPNQERFDLDDE